MFSRKNIFPLLIAVALLAGSCAGSRKQHRPYKKPKPGKVKPCNCPDFGESATVSYSNFA
jgi:hypothetical protein